VGYNAVADITGLSSFVQQYVVASQICEFPRNSPKIRTYSCSRSSKVIDLGATKAHMQLPFSH